MILAFDTPSITPYINLMLPPKQHPISKNKSIQAKMLIGLQGWAFNPFKPDGIILKSQSKNRINIRINANDEKGFGGYKGFNITAKKIFTTNDSLHALITDYQKNGWHAQSFSSFPDKLVDFITNIRSSLLSDISRAISLVAWRQNLPSYELRNPTLYIGTSKLFGPVPYKRVQQIQKIDRRDRWAESAMNFESIWKSEYSVQPLAHELLREAKSLVFSAPRSSILICCAALETGVKTHCKDIAPDTKWLLENLPAPPVFKLLKKYIPSLHNSLGRDMGFWEKSFANHIKQIQSLVETRNKIAHGTKIDIDEKALLEYLETSEDILYALDVLAGNEWANSHIRPNISDDLNLNHPKLMKMSFMITNSLKY